MEAWPRQRHVLLRAGPLSGGGGGGPEGLPSGRFRALEGTRPRQRLVLEEDVG